VIGYFGNIEELAEENTNFRRVLYSGAKLQLVLMSLPPGPGDGIVVPAGAHHNVICTGHEPLSV
jgi:hypothetical protein